MLRLGDDFVARLPRHATGAALMEHEHRWLAEVTGPLPVATPTLVVAGRPGAGYPWSWSVARWLEGTTGRATPPGDLVPVLTALHRPAPPGAPGNPFRDVPLRDREPRHAEALAEIGHPEAARLCAELASLALVPGPVGPPVWVHGDLHPRNLVVRDGRLAGVIDWGDLHAGDRAVDLAVFWMLEGEPGTVREDLAVDDDTWARARGWALVLGVMFLWLGKTKGDEGFVALGDHTLGRVSPRSDRP